MLDEERLKQDLQAFAAIRPLFVNLGWGLLNELDCTDLIKKGASLKELMEKREIKNKKMLETILDILVGNGVLKHEKNKYSFVSIPQPNKKEDIDFLKKNYNRSMEWIAICFKDAKEVITSGKPKDKAGFDDEKGLELWDAIMCESPYSLRKKAILIFTKELKDGNSVLDFGCGGGIGLEQILLETSKNIFLDGMDTSGNYLERAKKRMQHLYTNTQSEIIKRNIKKIQFTLFDPKKPLPKNKKYDVIFLSIVLNHIKEEKHAKLFKELKSMLKRNGRLVIYQLINQSKYNRVPIWVMHVVPSHQEYPFRETYLRNIKKNFRNVDCFFDGTITVSYD